MRNNYALIRGGMGSYYVSLPCQNDDARLSPWRTCSRDVIGDYRL